MLRHYLFPASLYLFSECLLAVNLNLPQITDSVMTIERNIAAIEVTDQNIFLISKTKNFLISGPFDDKAETREKKFGKLIDMKRLPIAGVAPYYNWNGIAKSGDGLLLLNGRDLEVLYVSKDAQLVSKHTIVWDLIRPPRDRGGEAPEFEISETRRRFKKAMQKKKNVRFHSLSFFRETEEKREYLIKNKLRNFPLLIMSCSKEIPSQCRITRTCNIRGVSKDLPEQIVGGAFDLKSRIMLSIEPKKKRIHYFKFGSCLNVRYLKYRNLPQKLKTGQGVVIDSKQRLWITTETPDDYFNASVFYWEKDHWL